MTIVKSVNLLSHLLCKNAPQMRGFSAHLRYNCKWNIFGFWTAVWTRCRLGLVGNCKKHFTPLSDITPMKRQPNPSNFQCSHQTVSINSTDSQKFLTCSYVKYKKLNISNYTNKTIFKTVHLKYGQINACLLTKTTPCMFLVRPSIAALHTSLKTSAGQQQQQFDHLGVGFIIPIYAEWNRGQDSYLNLIWL